jgi:3-oxoacyl-[acyl-carrier protein] reductase
VARAAPGGRSRARSRAATTPSSWSSYADQRQAELAVEEILAANATALAVRADLTDELDVKRLFVETIAAYGGVDVVAHATRQAPWKPEARA